MNILNSYSKVLGENTPFEKVVTTPYRYSVTPYISSGNTYIQIWDNKENKSIENILSWYSYFGNKDITELVKQVAKLENTYNS